jgi:thiol-disulfide isomerase/thioredoxin
MATASDTGNPPRPLAPRLRVGDGIPIFSLPNTSGVSVSSTVLLEPGPLIITFYRGIWCPYCRSDLIALMNATFVVQSRGDRWRPSRGKWRRTAIADFSSNTGPISRS